MRADKVVLLSIVSISAMVQALGQKSYTHEVSVVSDNDAYYFMSNDQYYTNGLVISYKYVPNNYKEKLTNNVIEFSIGQEIYNPFQACVTSVNRIDRPFAGYLYAEGAISRFYEKESMLRTSWQVGILGPSARAGEVQAFIHKTLNLYDTAGWQFQVKDAVGLNFHLNYLRSVRYFFNRHADVSWISELRLGTIHTDVGIGLLCRASLLPLLPLQHSTVSGAGIAKDRDGPMSKELYLYFRPRLWYVVYDATIQGGWFTDPSPVTFEPTPLKLYLELGARGAYKHFVVGYSLIYYTREAKNDLVKSHLYASIKAAFRF